MAGSFFADRYHHPGYHTAPVGYPHPPYMHPHFCYDSTCPSPSRHNMYFQTRARRGNGHSSFYSSSSLRQQRSITAQNISPIKSSVNHSCSVDFSEVSPSHSLVHEKASTSDNYGDNDFNSFDYFCVPNIPSR